MKRSIRNVFVAIFVVITVLCFGVGCSCKDDGHEEEVQSKIILSAYNVSMNVFDDYPLSYTTENITEGTAEWSSSDEKVVSVNGGVLTAKSVGNATVTVKIGEISAACEVSVFATQYRPVIYVGESKAVNLYPDGSYKIPASITYKGNPAEASFSYSSNDDAVATVSESGLIEATGTGEAIITVTAHFKGTDFFENVVVTVRSMISGVVSVDGEPIDDNGVSVVIDNSVTMEVETFNKGQSDDDITAEWSTQSDVISIVPTAKTLVINADQGKVSQEGETESVLLVLRKGDLTNEYNISITVLKKTEQKDAEVIINKATGSAVLPVSVDASEIVLVRDGTVTVNDVTAGAGNSVEFDATDMISGSRELRFESDTVIYVFANGLVVDSVIMNNTDLDAFGEEMINNNTEGSYYILGADIDYGGAYWTAGYPSNNSRFRGTFDGRGYKISNFVTHRGLVSSTVSGSIIKNLYVEPLLKGNAAGGGICNEHHGRVENCFVLLTVTNGETDVDFAGIASGNTTDGTIVNCIVKIVSYAGEPKKVNAIAAKNSGMISDCYAISSYSDYMYADTADGLYDTDEAFVSAVTTLPEGNGWNLNYWSLEYNELSFGGKKIIDNCIDKTATAVFDFDRTSGSNYTLTVTGIDAGLTIDDITAVRTVSDDTSLAFTKSGDNLVFANAVLSGYLGEQEVYLITSVYKYKVIICMASNILTTKDEFEAYFNTNAHKTTADDTYVVLKTDVDMGGAKWEYGWPTGNASEFKGTFDGRGHKVSNLNTRRGLFANILEGSIVKNLYVDISIVGSAAGSAICWNNAGIIRNCAVVTRITAGETVTPFSGVAVLNTGTVMNCFVKIESVTWGAGQTPKNFNAVVGSSAGAIATGCYAVALSEYVTALYGAVTDGLYSSDEAFFESVTELPEANGWNGYWSIEDGVLHFGGTVVLD